MRENTVKMVTRRCDGHCWTLPPPKKKAEGCDGMREEVEFRGAPQLCFLSIPLPKEGHSFFAPKLFRSSITKDHSFNTLFLIYNTASPHCSSNPPSTRYF